LERRLANRHLEKDLKTSPTSPKTVRYLTPYLCGRGSLLKEEVSRGEEERPAKKENSGTLLHHQKNPKSADKSARGKVWRKIYHSLKGG